LIVIIQAFHKGICQKEEIVHKNISTISVIDDKSLKGTEQPIETLSRRHFKEMIVTACWSVLKAKAEKHESELVEIGEKLNLSILYKYKILNFSIKKDSFF